MGKTVTDGPDEKVYGVVFTRGSEALRGLTDEVFIIVETVPLRKKPEEASGMKLMDPPQ